MPPRAGRHGQDGLPGEARGHDVGDASARPRCRPRRRGGQGSVGRRVLLPVGHMGAGLPPPVKSDGQRRPEASLCSLERQPPQQSVDWKHADQTHL